MSNATASDLRLKVSDWLSEVPVCLPSQSGFGSYHVIRQAGEGVDTAQGGYAHFLWRDTHTHTHTIFVCGSTPCD